MVEFSRKEEYLEEIRNQIRCKKARNLVAEEIENHIEDQKAVYLSEGMDEIAAARKALEQMGDPTEIGKQLDKIHKPRMEWYLLTAVLVLCSLGILFQSSLIHAADAAGITLAGGLRKHIFYLVLGFLLMLSVYFADYTFLGKYAKPIWVLLLSGILMYVPFALQINGGYPYLYAYALLLIPVYGGIIYAYGKCGYSGLIKCLLFGLFAGAVVCCFVVQVSVFLGLIYSCLLMLSVAVLKGWFKTSKIKSLLLIWGWNVIPVLVILFKGNILLPSSQLIRIQELFGKLAHPEQYPQGYRMNVARQVIAHARLFGETAEHGTGYEVVLNNSDYILTYVIGKFGIAAGVAIICLFLLFIGRMIHLSLKQRNSLGAFVGLGCGLVFILQGAAYILANLSIELVAQVNLPFISYGGASLIVNFIVLGILLSVFRNTYIRKEEPYRKRFRIKIGIERQSY